MSRQRKLTSPVAALLIVLATLAGCGSSATPTAAPTVVTAAQATATPLSPTAAPTATSVPPTPTQGPTVGGKLVIGVFSDIDTLDPHLTTVATAQRISEWIGGSLVTRDETGQIVPYLAENWSVSPDGLTYDFRLKKGIQFQNGTPLAAADYVYTLERILDPETMSFLAGDLAAVTSVEAVDDLTLRIHLSSVIPGLMDLLVSSAGAYQPLSKDYVDSTQGQYGRQPMSVGPYTFKEWKTGEKIVLERNPDFSWGPAYAHSGPFYIETIEVRIIPETSTLSAGIESGELDFANVSGTELSRFRDESKYTVLETLLPGVYPYLAMNLTQSPFDDLRVRQALNLALDRQTLIKAVEAGGAVEQRGPLSPSTIGYWAETEEIGYGYDLAQAKALMEEAGYTAGNDGMLTKDGKALKIELSIPTSKVKLGEVVQQQYKALGVDVEIKSLELGAWMQDIFTGQYSLSWAGWSWPTAWETLSHMYNSKYIGDVANIHNLTDATLDDLLNRLETAPDSDERQDICNQVQERVTEQAYIIPLYAGKYYGVLSTRVKGAQVSPYDSLAMPFLNDAYIETE